MGTLGLVASICATPANRWMDRWTKEWMPDVKLCDEHCLLTMGLNWLKDSLFSAHHFRCINTVVSVEKVTLTEINLSLSLFITGLL